MTSSELICNLNKESCSFHEKQNVRSFSVGMFIGMIKSFPMSPQAFLFTSILVLYFFFNFFSFVTFFQHFAVARLKAIESDVFLINAAFCMKVHVFKFIL